MSCHSPLRPRPLKRRCPATLRSSRHSSKVLRVISVFMLAQSVSESNSPHGAKSGTLAMPPLPGPRPETSGLRVLTRTEVTDGVALAVTVEILQTSRPTDELPPPCPVAESAARGVGNPSTRSREIELSEIARDRAGSGRQGGKSGARSGFSLRARLVRSATKRARLTGGIRARRIVGTGCRTWESMSRRGQAARPRAARPSGHRRRLAQLQAARRISM